MNRIEDTGTLFIRDAPEPLRRALAAYAGTHGIAGGMGGAAIRLLLESPALQPDLERVRAAMGERSDESR